MQVHVKRFLALLLVLMLMGIAGPAGVLATGFSTAAESDSSHGAFGDDGSWTLDEDGLLTVSGSGSIPGNASVPDGAPWYDCRTQIQTAVIENGIICIGAYAFSGCTNLTAVDIPATVTAIGAGAFHGCTALTAVELPAGVTALEQNLFMGCTSLNRIHLHEGIREIGIGAFYGCHGLTELILPESLEEIGSSAFADCDGLLSMGIPNRITHLPINLFAGCYKLRSVSFPAALTSMGYGVFLSCPGIASVDFPAALSEVPDQTYMKCYGLTQIMLHDRITRIGVEAFEDCDRLHSITVPASVTQIDIQAFNGSGLEEIIFEGSAPLIADNAFGGVCATAYYPASDPSWTEDVRRNYGGTVTWVPVAAAPAENPFTDVPDEAYYRDAVLWAVETGITAGIQPDRFGPAEACTREQVVTFLWRLMGCPEPEIAENPFRDVTTAAYAHKAILWAVENGFTAGVAENLFGVGHTVTRGQFITLLWHAMGRPAPAGENPFADVEPGSFYEAPAVWASEAGVTAGLGNHIFAPASPCTRAQVVTFLYSAAHSGNLFP